MWLLKKLTLINITDTPRTPMTMAFCTITLANARLHPVDHIREQNCSFWFKQQLAGKMMEIRSPLTSLDATTVDLLFGNSTPM